MANSADPDQLASSEANWSGSTLFAKQSISGFSRTRVKGSASLILGPWLSHLTCNQNYLWSLWQPCVEPFWAGVFLLVWGSQLGLHTPAKGIQVCYRRSLWFYVVFFFVLMFLLTNPWVLLALAVMKYMWFLIVLGFNDTSTLVGHFVSSPKEREKRDLEEIVEGMKKRKKEERGTGMKRKKQKK